MITRTAAADWLKKSALLSAAHPKSVKKNFASDEKLRREILRECDFGHKDRNGRRQHSLLNTGTIFKWWWLSILWFWRVHLVVVLCMYFVYLFCWCCSVMYCDVRCVDEDDAQEDLEVKWEKWRNLRHVQNGEKCKIPAFSNIPIKRDKNSQSKTLLIGQTSQTQRPMKVKLIDVVHPLGFSWWQGFEFYLCCQSKLIIC